MRARNQTLIRFSLPLLILLAGFGVYGLLKSMKAEPARKPRTAGAPLVEVRAVTPGERTVQVNAQGAVIPARRIQVLSEVAGRVVWQSPELLPGGRFEEGNVLARIDPRDYRVAVEEQEAAVSRAELELEMERSRQLVARREWELFQKNGSDGAEGKALTLREPQLRAAEVALEAAKSLLERAQLNLSRTTIRAPFNGFVETKSVDPGQYVTPQTQLATFVGSDRFWVQVAVPYDQLQWITVPASSGEPGSPVRIVYDAGSEHVERIGRVVKLLPNVDEVGRMTRLLVAIEDPLSLEPSDKAPLLLGSYVDVAIEGRTVPGVVEVPRLALRDDNRVFLLSAENVLVVHPVQILWRGEEAVWVRGCERAPCKGGLAAGARLILTDIPTPVAGMKLRLAESKPVPTRSAPRAGLP